MVTFATVNAKSYGGVLNSSLGTPQNRTNPNEIFYGSSFFTDQIYAGIGQDILYGYGGDDLLNGQQGNDNLYGGDGNDTLYGGQQNSTYADGDDYLDGGAGNDKLYGQIGNDRLFGGTGDDWLYGGADNDYLDGGAGNDYLDGGTGIDTLLGGNGSDILVGGAGPDRLTGGFDADWFNLVNNGNSPSTITDFQAGIDKIVLDAANFGITPFPLNQVTRGFVNTQFVKTVFPNKSFYTLDASNIEFVNAAGLGSATAKIVVVGIQAGTAGQTTNPIALYVNNGGVYDKFAELTNGVIPGFTGGSSDFLIYG